MTEGYESLTVRPYELMCIVCRIGEGRVGDLGDERLNEILSAVRNNPNMPLTLRCNVDAVYKYQNPGRADDTPEGDLFNDKRDLDILQRLGLVPGATRPGIELFERLLMKIPTADGICRYHEITSQTWQGCARGGNGHYEKGHAMGLEAVIPPRNEGEKAAFKKDSVEAMYKADTLRIRPHHLMCMTCFHKGRTQDELEAIEEDNLFEAIDIMQKNPEIPVTLIPGCCMICPPCSHYDPKTSLCIGGQGMSLRDQKKDLDVLQRLGLKFGDTLPAREVLKRLYDEILSTRQICGYEDGIERGHEWRICGEPEGSERYQKGRAAGIGVL